MIAMAASALAITLGGPEYQEALARVKLHEHDDAARAFTAQRLLPAVSSHQTLISLCRRLDSRDEISFSVIVSYRDGKPDRLYLDQDTPFGRCMAEGLADTDYPLSPPYPDFAGDVGGRIRFLGSIPPPKAR
jgi:hypothetical protein